MAWTDPRTWTPGEVVVSAQLNDEYDRVERALRYAYVPIVTHPVTVLVTPDMFGTFVVPVTEPERAAPRPARGIRIGGFGGGRC